MFASGYADGYLFRCRSASSELSRPQLATAAEFGCAGRSSAGYVTAGLQFCVHKPVFCASAGAVTQLIVLAHSAA